MEKNERDKKSFELYVKLMIGYLIMLLGLVVMLVLLCPSKAHAAAQSDDVEVHGLAHMEAGSAIAAVTAVALLDYQKPHPYWCALAEIGNAVVGTVIYEKATHKNSNDTIQHTVQGATGALTVTGFKLVILNYHFK